MFNDKFFKKVYVAGIENEKEEGINAAIKLCKKLLEFEKNRLMSNVKITNKLNVTLNELSDQQEFCNDDNFASFKL